MIHYYRIRLTLKGRASYYGNTDVERDSESV